MGERRKVLQYFEKEKNYMNDRINDGIEKYRKGNIKIKLVDKNGNSIENASVTAELKNHEFNFGANIFMLDTLTDVSNYVEKNKESLQKLNINKFSDCSALNREYKEMFKEMFNFATVPFYWSGIEPIKGKVRFQKNEPNVFRRPTPDSCVKFCKENGIRTKAHCLNYDGHTPKWIQESDDAGYVKKKLEWYFSECAKYFSDSIQGWEVTNETLVLYPQPMGETKFYFEPDFVSWSFNTARKYFKNNELIINDNHETVWQYYLHYRSSYYMQIKQELENGTPIDAIGMQYHVFYKRDKELEMASKFYNPRFIYEVLDRYSDFGKPFQITEITIPAYSNEPEDEEIQAEILKNLYSIWFSHPNMETIVYWNLVEGYLGPVLDMSAGENYYHGGFVRADFTKKPAYEVLRHLIHEEWHSNESVTTDKNGEAEIKGFYGDYEVMVTNNGKHSVHTFKASKNGDNTFTICV